jgi:Protein of unknown function (DUF3540)
MGHRDDLSSLDLLAGNAGGTWLSAVVHEVDAAGAVLLALAAGAGTARGDGAVRAGVALSCLVAPAAGDRVAVFQDGAGRRYVTTILERAAPGPLSLCSERAIEIGSAAGIRLRAPLLEAVGDRFSACFRSVRTIAAEAVLESKLARLCTGLLDVVAQRIGVHAEHSHRQIDGTEQLRCRDLDLRASELAQVRAHTTIVKAKTLVKIDAAQIQIG